MNGAVRQGMPGGVQAPNNMLAIGNPPFMQNSPHLGQPPLGQAMGVPQNMNPSNPPMGMLSGGPVPPTVNQRYPMPPNGMPQHQQQQRPMLLRQGQNPPQLNPAGGTPSAAHMQAQLQGMQFPGNMMQQPPGQNNAVRRVQSQPTMNPMGGMPNAVGVNMPMGLNAQTSMPAQIRQAQVAHQQQQQQIRLQQQQQALMQTEMMRSQAPNQSMPPNMARTPSTQSQVMSSLSQPSLGMQHPGGMQPAHHQNPFPNGGPIPSQHPPPQLSSSPRPTQSHTPSMSLGAPGPSHTPVNRARMTPDNSNMSFMGYPASQFPGNNAARVPSNSNPNGYPSFVPSSSTPTPMQMDLPQSSPSGMIHSQGGTPNRSSFMATPAQHYELMTSNQAMDIYPPSFGMPPPAAVPPPRPPSHTTNPHQPPQQQSNPQQQPPHQQPQTHHQSPPQSDQMNVHPQRPQSQPQQMMPGRPPSQTGTTRTPRPNQQPLPSAGLPGPLTATGRLPVAQQTQGPPGPAMMPIAPRPPPAIGGVPPPSSAQMTVDAPPSVAAPIQRPPLAPTSGLLSPGQGIIRLLQFSGVLSSEAKTKLQLSWWSDLVKEYFTPRAMMKLTLWRDNQRIEAKPFEIGVPILPRFFLVTTQSGVKSMSFSLDGARERAYTGQGGHTVVECVSAIWTYKYANGYTVVLRGPLTAHVVVTAAVPPGSSQAPQYTLKFDELQFDANLHDKYIALDSILGSRSIEPPKTPGTRHVPTPTPGTSSQAQQQQQQIEEDKGWEEPRVLIEHGSIPGEPVNAFGIPQATMRCLELAESVSAMADLISFSKESILGPLDALKRYTNKIRESQISGGPHQQSMNTMPLNNSNTTLSNSFPYQPSIGHTPSVTLFSSAASSITNPQPPIPPSSMNSPQNTPSSSANSPEKQLKTIPQPQPQQAQTPSQSGPASSPAVSSGGTTNTPAMSNTSLKRKQGDASSPTVGNSEQQPPKRMVRKRGRTGTTGAG